MSALTFPHYGIYEPLSACTPGRSYRNSKAAAPRRNRAVSRRRYYSPSQGRFLGRDPIDEHGGLHLYGFCGNNPIDHFDVLGNMWEVVDNGDGTFTGHAWDTPDNGPVEVGSRIFFTSAAANEWASNLSAGIRDAGDFGGQTSLVSHDTTLYVGGTAVGQLSGSDLASYSIIAQQQDLLLFAPNSGGSGTGSSSTSFRGGNTISSVAYTGEKIVVKDANGNTIRVASASSENPGVTDTNLPYKGPMPPGLWFFDPNDISSSGVVRTVGNALRLSDWGTARVVLQPYIGTDTQGRTNLFIHGGTTPGSNGCIDIGTADSWFFPMLKQQPDPVLIIVLPSKPGGKG